MKASYAVSLGLGLGGLLAAGFSFGYYFHLNTEIERFARETDRTSSDYRLTLVWKRYSGDTLSTPLILAAPDPEKTASRDAWSRWRWELSNPEEPCDPDAHRLVWRYKADRWELVNDLAEDLSVNPFPEAEPGG